MKKIGILSFWNVPNYGTFLQAYAMQKIVENRYPDNDVRQVAHLSKRHYDVYYSQVNKNYRCWVFNPKFYFNLFSNFFKTKHYCTIRKFLNYYKIFPCFKVEDVCGKNSLDVLILGSDIIWDYSISFFDNDKMLFGDGINAKTKIAYAPSFGTIKANAVVPKWVKDSLEQLDFISVRDEKSKQIIQNNIPKDVNVVLDPTLLWNFNIDKNIVEPNIKENYIIVYGGSFSEELIEGATSYSSQHNVKLVCLDSLDDKNNWCDINIHQDNLTPFEWVGWFKNADAVMTTTFHGLMFGLIFNKRIIFQPTQFILDKCSCLIDKLGLRYPLVECKSFSEKYDWEWNYEKINSVLEKMREDSYNYLDKVFSHVK